MIGDSKPPLLAKDFAPYLLRVKDAKPDAMFVFLGASENNALFLREYRDLGLDKAGIKIIAIGSMLEDDALDAEGDAALGIVSAYHYSGVYQSALNKQFQRDFAAQVGGKFRPNYAAYAGYDTIAAVYKIIAAQGGKIDPRQDDADPARHVVREPAWTDPHRCANARTSCRTSICGASERRNGQLVNVIIATIPMVKNPNETY